MPRLLIATGEPAGVGPDLTLALLGGNSRLALTALGSRRLLAARARRLGLPFAAAAHTPGRAAAGGKRAVWNTPLQVPARLGKPNPANAQYVLRQLRLAADACLRGDFNALLTAPVSKQSILAAGERFVGQTEFLAARAGAKTPVMLLAGPRLRVALATTHLPLRRVPAALSTRGIFNILTVLHNELPRYFAAQKPPKILVCGLNPHAGEGGFLGDEETRVIAPAIAKARQRGICAEGPYSADTVFLHGKTPHADCVLAMYHDQALPAIKLLDFDDAVNVTLGLPFLRVSPDHGIAADLAGTGRARPNSMKAALALATRALARA